MSKVIRRLRLLKPHHRPKEMWKEGETRIPVVSEAMHGVISKLVHERGRVAPLAKIRVDTGECVRKELLVAVEGNYVGQKVEIGDSAPVAVGNALKLKNIPEGTDVCSVERRPYDGGKMARTSGAYVTVVGHNRDTNITTVRLPSGEKKAISSECRAVVGVIAGGGVNEKPLLKASRAHYRAKARGLYWPTVRGVAMNPVDHPHGGGNKQHIGHPSTISKHAPPGQKVGLVAARRTGLRRGSKKVLNK